jgi:plasmid replication initiation protein
MEIKKKIPEKKVVKKKVTDFKENRQVRVSKDCYELDRIRFKLSVHGNRLLYAIAQSLDYKQTELFPELGFDIQAVFLYLGIENSNRRFELLRDALDNISENWFKYKTTTKTGGTRWEGMAWITYYSFANDAPLLNIQINEKVKPYLLKLGQYAVIRPKDYLKLTTEHQNWFYPYLKLRKDLGKWRVSIDELKFAMFLEDSPSYDPAQNKNATEKFLNRVIGIQVSEKAKLENQAAKAAKRKPHLIEWDYIEDKDGNKTGTLYAIHSGTDINVTASVEKTGRSYTHITFFISEKIKKPKTTPKVIQIAENDFGKANDRNKRAKTTQSIGSLFNNEAFADMPPPSKVKYFTAEQVKEMAKEFQMSQTILIEKMRLKPNVDGGYYQDNA